MVISTRDGVINGLTADSADRILIDKAQVTSNSTTETSFWTVPGQPAAGAIPTSAAICTMSTVGAINFTPQTAPITNYLGYLYLTAAAGYAWTLYDRLAHMGGLSFASTTSQTVNLDVSTLGVPAARYGLANYSEIRWYLESYAVSGATPATVTCTVTYDDGSTGTLDPISVATTAAVPVGKLFSLSAKIPAAKAGRYIRGVISATLSNSTGTAGNFGFTAMRYRTQVVLPTATYMGQVYDYAALGLPEIINNSCLMFTIMGGVTLAGKVFGTGKIIHG